MKIIRMFILIIIIPVSSSVAEYRAYELLIENQDSGQQRRVISTLDHLQYPTYYPLSKGEVVSYVKSWICRENTSSYKEICQAPDQDRSLSSLPKAN